MADSSDTRSSKVVATVATVLLVGSFVWITALMGRNARQEHTVRKEKLSRETMLSEKLLLEKEIAKLNGEKTAQQKAIHELYRQQGVLSDRIQIKDEKIRALTIFNAPFHAMRQRQRALENEKYELIQKVSYYQDTLLGLQREHNDALRTVELLREQNRGLSTELRIAQITSVNDVRVEALTRRNGVTSKARNVRSLKASVTLAAAVQQPVFRVVTPEGRILSSAEGSMTLHTKDNEAASPFIILQKNPGALRKKVEMVFVPRQRLAGGIYTIEVLNEGAVIGSLQTKLR